MAEPGASLKGADTKGFSLYRRILGSTPIVTSLLRISSVNWLRGCRWSFKRSEMAFS